MAEEMVTLSFMGQDEENYMMMARAIAVGRHAILSLDSPSLGEGVLRARIAELEIEVTDRDARDEIVTALSGGLDAIDAAADKWVELTEVRRSTQAIASVFAQWASDDIMQRFINSIVGLQHLAFGEGYYIAHEVATPTTNAPVDDIERVAQFLRDEAQSQRIAKDQAYRDGHPWKAYKYAGELLDKLADKLESGR